MKLDAQAALRSIASHKRKNAGNAFTRGKRVSVFPLNAKDRSAIRSVAAQHIERIDILLDVEKKIDFFSTKSFEETQRRRLELRASPELSARRIKI